MRRTWITGLGVLALSLVGQVAQAADHQDGPAVKTDPSTDITDVFTWMNATGDKVYLVMDVSPFADKASSKFSNSAKYVFHTTAVDGLLGGKVGNVVDVVCTFDGTGKISCWAIDRMNNNAVLDYINGDASSDAAPITSAHMKVFAGVRNDPFFFNLDGFKDLAAFVHMNAGGLTFNNLGCPAIDAQTSQLAVTVLKSTMTGTKPAVDHFAKGNVLSIVIAIDKSTLTSGNKYLSVWASTNQ
jgi:hypothetical protein